MKAIQTLLEKTGLVKKKARNVTHEEVPPITDEVLKAKAIRYLTDDLYNVKIEFIKKDGSTRWILCTLAENLIPVKSRPKKESLVTFEADVCKVFDLEKKAWRSFRWNSVQSIDVHSSDNEFLNSKTVPAFLESDEQNATI